MPLFAFAPMLLLLSSAHAETALEAVAAAEGVPLGDLLCVKDFSGCPAGWADFDGSCSAPPSYEGPCPREVVFAGSPKEKACWQSSVEPLTRAWAHAPRTFLLSSTSPGTQAHVSKQI